jgi:hypothetical protein
MSSLKEDFSVEHTCRVEDDCAREERPCRSASAICASIDGPAPLMARGGEGGATASEEGIDWLQGGGVVELPCWGADTAGAAVECILPDATAAASVACSHP